MLVYRNYILSSVLFFFSCFSGTFAQDFLLEANHFADSIEIESLIENAQKNYRQNSDLAYKQLERAYQISKEIQNKLGEAKYWDMLGYFKRNEANYRESIQHHLSALEIAINLKDSLLLTRVYNNLGVAYRRTDQYQKATENHLKALSIASKINSLRSKTIAINSLGNIESAQENYDKAIEYFKEALQIEQESTNILGLAINYNNIGEAYEHKGDYDEALVYYNLSLENNQLLNNTKGMVISYNSLGNIYKHKKQFELALSYYQKALSLADSLNEKYYDAFIHINLGEVFLRLNAFENSLNYLTEAVSISKEINSKLNLRDANFLLSEVYERMGNHSLSLQHFKTASLFKDSILNIEATRNMAYLKTIYNQEKQEREIERLTTLQSIQEKENRSQRRYLILILFALILASTGFFTYYRMYSYKQKANITLKIQKKEIEKQRNFIEQKNKNLEQANYLIEKYIHTLTDSIEYAQKIQHAILPPMEELSMYFNENFVLYIPKDIVSGDFYWFGQVDDKILVSAVDCTGHGVPGAFMSLIAFELINMAVHKNNLLSPEKILDYLHEEVKISLRKTDLHNGLKDGMDISFCSIDKGTGLLEFAGALSPVFIIRNRKLFSLKYDKWSIGTIYLNHNDTYSKKQFQLEKGDAVYLFTDGFISQFGGPKNKKINKTMFLDTLLNIQDLSMMDQKVVLNEIFTNWRGRKEQTDDILIIGFKYN